jgi:hypothetical protein
MRSDRPCLHSALYCTVLYSASPFKVPSTPQRVFELYALHESHREADLRRESGPVKGCRTPARAGRVVSSRRELRVGVRQPFPAVNTFSAPVRTSTRTSGSASSASTTAASSRRSSSDNTLSRSGRFNVSVAKPSAQRSTMMVRYMRPPCLSRAHSPLKTGLRRSTWATMPSCASREAETRASVSASSSSCASRRIEPARRKSRLISP